MQIKLFGYSCDDDQQLSAIHTGAVQNNSNRPLLILAPGFLAEALEEDKIQDNKCEKPFKFAIRAAKEMLANSGTTLSEYPDIACLAWPSVDNCRQELRTLLSNPLYVGDYADSFCDFLLTIPDRKIVFLSFSYGGAFLQQVGAAAYQKDLSFPNITVLSLGHPVGVKGFELFGLNGLYAVGNNDRVIRKALNKTTSETENLEPSIMHTTKWYTENRGIYSFPVPIEVILPAPSQKINGISNINPKDIFDEYAHHPLGYALASPGSRTFIDGRYRDSFIHSAILQRFFAKLLANDSPKSIEETFNESAGSVISRLHPHLDPDQITHRLARGISL